MNTTPSASAQAHVDVLARPGVAALEVIVAALGRELARRLPELGWHLAVAESCTGGLLCAQLTRIPGASQWFEQGWVTYSNAAKQRELGVSAATLTEYGAVSEPCAREMALGALARADADLSLAITGIAGPDGGSAEKPVGTVMLACARRHPEALLAQTLHLSGSRDEVRWQALDEALRALLRLATTGEAPTMTA